MARHVIIWNPTSGSGKRAPVEALVALLNARGCPTVVRETNAAGHATQLAAEAVVEEAAEANGEEASVVIAAGGDGTIREVAAGLVGSDVPLALFPVGTANSLARELKMPPRLSPAAIADIIAARHIMPIYPGVVRAGDRQEIFLESAGAGFDSRAVEAVTPNLKRRFGPMAYVLTALDRVIRNPHERLIIEAPGLAGPVSATWVIAVRTDRYGGWFRLGTGLTAGEPRLVILYVDAKSRFTYVRCVIGLLLGRMARVRGVNSIEVTGQVDLTDQPDVATPTPTPGGVPLQLDGDIIARTPVTIGLEARPLNIIIPAPVTVN